MGTKVEKIVELGGQMKRKNTEFDDYVITQIKRSFKFLETDYDCSIDKIENESWGLNVFYKNLTTAVRVFLDDSGIGMGVELIRLVNNAIPDRPSYYRKNTKIHFYALGNILDIRVPYLYIDEPTLDELLFNPGCEKVMSSVIKQHAKALKMYAQDILKGDFSIFDELERTYDERMKKAIERLRKQGRDEKGCPL